MPILPTLDGHERDFKSIGWDWGLWANRCVVGFRSNVSRRGKSNSVFRILGYWCEWHSSINGFWNDLQNLLDKAGCCGGVAPPIPTMARDNSHHVGSRKPYGPARSLGAFLPTLRKDSEETANFAQTMTQ